jgi:hypothetical protein
MVRKKKSPRKAAVKYADDQMSLYIRARDKRCVLCGKRENLTNGHLITRGKYSTRWLEKNCYCQCTGCNCLHEYQPERFTLWWIGKHSIEEYEEMVLESNTPKKFSTAEIRAIGEMYRDMRKELERE